MRHTLVLLRKSFAFLFFCALFTFNICISSAEDKIPDPTPISFLTPQHYTLLQEILNTHLNYFLSNDVITSSGLPLGAYKEGDRGRYNYSNPTEWGYAMLAWITAADRGKIAVQSAAAKIEKALDTMIALQKDPVQNYQNLFYPYYYVTSRAGEDLSMPYHDANLWIPSIDNGFLYTSLLITQGWANIKGLSAIESKASSISSKMNFRVFLEPAKQYLTHLVNASTGAQGSSHWDIYSDEGGMMIWIAYASGSVILDEYKALIDAMQRPTREWNSIVVKEAAWFNAMFTWGVRSLGGFPVATWETGVSNQYSVGSFAPNVKAHLAYGDSLGIYYPAFSDAMTQSGSTGRYTPPNISNNAPTDIPPHIVPHAFFIPFCIGPDIAQSDLDGLITKITDLKNDAAHYYHNGSDTHKPFGFEVTASPAKDNTSYAGVESRYIFETLSQAYIALSIQQGLNINDGKQTFLHYASKVPGYFSKVKDAVGYLYAETVNAAIRVPADYSTIQAAIDAAANGDTILVSEGTYNESVNFNKSGVILKGESQSAIINGLSGLPAITCSDLSGGNKAKISNFTINRGSGSNYAIRCMGTTTSLQIENNYLPASGIYLEDTASVIIQNNKIDNCSPVRSAGHNNVLIIGNTFNNTLGPNPPGIYLVSTTGLIKDNYFSARWNGALEISGGSNVDIINNKFTFCYGWNDNAGVNVLNSTANLWNNSFSTCTIYSYGNSCGVFADGSSVSLYNNVFFKNTGHKGVAAYINNSNFVAKNNIFTNNSGDEVIYVSGSGTQDFSYNDIWNNFITQNTIGVTFGPGNIELDPLFVDTLNFGLSFDSPCVDAGDPNIQFNDLNVSQNDMGIHGGPYGDMLDFVLNMTEMPWYQNAAYNSTGAAVSQMILDYIIHGAGQPAISQNTIYQYAKSPNPFGPELNADEVDKVLGHFDPYDTLVTGWADSYDSLSDGNPYQGYNYSVDSYSQGPEAINTYMRDICHWMAYKVTKEDWWLGGQLVARPNTPAAIPIYGTYNHWVAVKGFAASANPSPDPTDPWNTPDFVVYGFWMKDPLVSGIGQNTYKTAAECSSTYFLPLVSPGDPYNGKYLQVAEPPAERSNAAAQIIPSKADLGNLNFIGISVGENNNLMTKTNRMAAPGFMLNSPKINIKKKQGWQDLVDKNILSDSEAVNAFNNSRMGKFVSVRRPDIKGQDYYLVPFEKKVARNKYLTCGVIILNSDNGSFKEASWTDKPEIFLKVDRNAALKLLERFLLKQRDKELSSIPRRPLKQYTLQYTAVARNYGLLLSGLRRAQIQLLWQPNKYSTSPYKPYWQIVESKNTWYVTQEGVVIP